jgi:hypothetical protein
MAVPRSDTSETEGQIRELAAQLHSYRQHPCLLFVSRHLLHSDVLAVRDALGEQAGDHLDLLVASPGGDIEAAYLVARELRRRFAQLTVFVPFRAKSAATLLCLAADELVLGSLGELGPLDQQGGEKQKADSPLNTSRLVPFKALQQLQHGAAEMYDELVGRIARKSGMRLFEAGSKAAEFTQGLYGPIFAQLDPVHLAESARGLEIGGEYAERLLRRYRPACWADHGPKLLDRLVHSYPTHGFVIDREEAEELGLPIRAPARPEAALLDRLALALIAFGTEQDLITLAGPPPATVAAVQQVLDRLPAKRRGGAIRRRPLPGTQAARTPRGRLDP